MATLSFCLFLWSKFCRTDLLILVPKFLHNLRFKKESIHLSLDERATARSPIGDADAGFSDDNDEEDDSENVTLESALQGGTVVKFNI